MSVNALRVSDLRDLLQGPAFAAWWAELGRVEATLREARAKRDDLQAQLELMQARAEGAEESAAETLSRAGEVEDGASGMSAESQELENRALELVGRFEEQRFRVSELWYRLGGAERVLEERREALAAAGGEATAPRAAEGKRRAAEAARLVKEADRAARDLREAYQREAPRKDRLWEQVERSWARSAEIALLVAEGRWQTRRVKLAAERLFQEAKDRRARAKRLKADLAAALREHDGAARMRSMLLAEARQRFGCVAGTSFLYWRRRGDQRGALAVALDDDGEAYNVEVKALGMYLVDRQRGVAFLEPAREGRVVTDEEGDRRFEEWFLGPRAGRVVSRPD